MSSHLTTTVTALLKTIQYAPEYARIHSQHSPELFEEAWQALTSQEQQRVTQLVNENKQPTPQELATMLANAATYERLAEIKADFGRDACRQAWNLLQRDVRDRLAALCPNQEKPQPENKAAAVSHSKPKNSSLWDKTAAIEELEEAITAVDDDESLHEEAKEDKRQQLFEQWLASDQAWKTKLDSCGYAISCLEKEAETIKAMRDQLKERQEQKRTQAQRLRNYMLAAMRRRGIDKLRGTYCTVYEQTRTPLRINGEPEDLPPEYKRVTVEARMSELKQALKEAESAGKLFEYAYWGEAETSVVVIRIK